MATFDPAPGDRVPGEHPDDIAIIGWAQTPMVRHTDKTETQHLLEVVTGAQVLRVQPL